MSNQVLAFSQFLGSIDSPDLILYRIKTSRVGYMLEWALEYYDVPLARISHTGSTASAQSSALTALRSVGLLSVPYSTLAGASVARLVRSALPPLRHEPV